MIFCNGRGFSNFMLDGGVEYFPTTGRHCVAWMMFFHVGLNSSLKPYFVYEVLKFSLFAVSELIFLFYIEKYDFLLQCEVGWISLCLVGLLAKQ